MTACILCGATATDQTGALKHEGACPHFMRGPDPGGDPAEWETLFDVAPAPTAVDRDRATIAAAGFDSFGEAFKAAAAVERARVELERRPETIELLERERFYGRAIDAHDACRMIRDDLDD